MTWQPIESAPKDGTFILVVGISYNDPSRGHYFDVVCWREEENEFCSETDGSYRTEDSGWETRCFLTHWMPLPEPPK